MTGSSGGQPNSLKSLRVPASVLSKVVEMVMFVTAEPNSSVSRIRGPAASERLRQQSRTSTFIARKM